MKVTLVKREEIEFNLTEDKCEKISNKTFRMLTGYEPANETENNNPRMAAFKSKDEFIAEAHNYPLDEDADIYINQKGNIFCYLKGEALKHNEEATTDVAADTEENKAE